MDIILTRHTSLALLRAARSDAGLELHAVDVTSCPDEVLPSAELEATFDYLAPFVGEASPEMPYQVACSRQIKHVCDPRLVAHARKVTLPKGSYLEVCPVSQAEGDARLPEGVRVLIEGPALALVTYAEVLTRRVGRGVLSRWLATDMVVALGDELCGTYARDAMNPFGGRCSYDVEQAASRNEIEKSLWRMSGLAGLDLARRAIPYVANRSASPMETLHHMMETLPPRLSGLSIGHAQLNERIVPTSQQQRVLTVKEGIRPDLYWKQWKIAIEHDGEEGHFTRCRWRSDHERVQDYQVCGIKVFTTTYDDVKSVARFNAFVEKLCVSIAEAGSPNVSKRVRALMRSSEFRSRQGELLNVLLPNSSDLAY